MPTSTNKRIKMKHANYKAPPEGTIAAVPPTNIMHYPIKNNNIIKGIRLKT